MRNNIARLSSGQEAHVLSTFMKNLNTTRENEFSRLSTSGFFVPERGRRRYSARSTCSITTCNSSTTPRCRREMARLIGLAVTDIVIVYRVDWGGLLEPVEPTPLGHPAPSYREKARNLGAYLRVSSTASFDPLENSR